MWKHNNKHMCRVKENVSRHPDQDSILIWVNPYAASSSRVSYAVGSLPKVGKPTPFSMSTQFNGEANNDVWLQKRSEVSQEVLDKTWQRLIPLCFWGPAPDQPWDRSRINSASVLVANGVRVVPLCGWRWFWRTLFLPCIQTQQMFRKSMSIVLHQRVKAPVYVYLHFP